MKRGFTVLEVTMAIFMAALISLSLYQLLRTATRGVSDMVATMDVDTGVAAFYNQVEKDVTGMFAPFSSIEKFAKKDFEEKKEKGFPFKRDKKELSFENEPIENVFVLEAQGDTFFWSFITTGGIAMLDADGARAPIPFVRRVAYILEPDPERPGEKRLMYRFSGNTIELSHIRSASFSPSYELIGGIKNLSIELTLMQVVEKDSEEGGTQATTQTVALKQWQTDEVWQKYKTLIPAYVILSGRRVDRFGAEYPFEIAAQVYAYNPYVEKEKTLFEALEDVANKLWKK